MGAGLSEPEFWGSTPYLTGLSVAARVKRQGEMAMLTGWWSERLAREDRLKSFASYLEPETDSEDAEMATQEAAAREWAEAHGLKFTKETPNG